MISRKGQKTIKGGVVGKYVKKDTPPEMPSKFVYIFKKKNLRLSASRRQFLSIFILGVIPTYVFNCHLDLLIIILKTGPKIFIQ